MRQRSLASPTSFRKLISSGRVESQYLVGAASPSGHSMSNHSGVISSGSRYGWAARTRTRAKREESQSAEPSRQRIVRQALFGRRSESFLTEIRPGSSRRPVLLIGLPRRRGEVPGGQTRQVD